jgi:glucose/mannose transport system permease protein
MLLPSIILIGLFVYGFIGNTFWMSLTDWGGVAALAEKPVKISPGLTNYKDLFTGFFGGRFPQDLVNAVYYSVMLLVGAIGRGCSSPSCWTTNRRAKIFPNHFLYPMSLSFHRHRDHLALDARAPGRGQPPAHLCGRRAAQFRWLSSTQAMLEFNWQNLLQIGVYIIAADTDLRASGAQTKSGQSLKRWLLPGVVLGLLGWLGGDLLPKALFMEESHGFNLATLGIILATIWQYSGYTMALYLAGFTGISQDLRDAAMLDGASTSSIIATWPCPCSSRSPSAP